MPAPARNKNFDTDQEVLEKELALGKDLLKKAIQALNENVLSQIAK